MSARTGVKDEGFKSLIQKLPESMPPRLKSQAAAGHLVEKRAELAARAALERLAHQVHAEEEQAQPADHREHIENIHIFYLSFFLF